MSEGNPGVSDLLRRAASDIRYLADRGYPKDSAVKFVSDHYRLPEEDRFVLTRVVVPSEIAIARRRKALPLEDVRGRDLFLDGYNVLITVESLLKGFPVFTCDDGFLRDAQGIFKSYKTSEVTSLALKEILDLLAQTSPSWIEVILDRQMSMSGVLAAAVREELGKRSLQGTARTARDVDHQLKAVEGVIATGDGNVIDAARMVVDVPAEVSGRLGISTIQL